MASPHGTRPPFRAALACLVLLSLGLPAALVTASPATAAPVTDPVFSGGRFGAGNYALDNNEAEAFLEDSDNHADLGVSTLTVTAEVTDVTQGHLDGIDIFFDGWVWDGDWNAGEVDRIVDWVEAGGVVLANEDHSVADELGTAFGVPTAGNRSVAGDPTIEISPAPGAGSHPMVTGAFGTWTTVGAAGTTGYFAEPLPAEWSIIAVDEMDRPVLIERNWGLGHVVLSADEALFRTDHNPDPIEPAAAISMGNILAYLISLTHEGIAPLEFTAPADQNHETDSAITPLQLLPLTSEGDGSDITFAWGAHPVGLTLNPTTGEVTGTPTEVFSGTVTVTATPEHGPEAMAAFDWTITEAPEPTPTVVPTPTPTPTVMPTPTPTPAPTECLPDGALSFAGDTPGVETAGDDFGEAMATGDFDGDGNLDLAVGSPGDRNGAGAVTVYLAPCSDAPTRYTQAGSVPGSNERGDGFGSALAAGDFNDDGHDDLAIGVPGEDTGNRKNDGNVVVLYGSPDGLRKSGGQQWSQRGSKPGRPQSGDRLGSALGVGDFDGDGSDDLLIGVPGDRVAGRNNTGSFLVFYGTGSGLSNAGSDQFRQKGSLANHGQRGDRLGSAIAVGDFNGDGNDDAAVSAPNEDLASGDNAGIVHILSGATSGLGTSGQQVIKGAASNARAGYVLSAGDVTDDGIADLIISIDDSTHSGSVLVYRGRAGQSAQLIDTIMQGEGTASGAAAGNRFGYATAVTDLDGDGSPELAVGAPGETVAGSSKAGAVHVFQSVAGAISRAEVGHLTKADADVAGSAVAGADFGSALTAGDGVLFAAAPDDVVDGVSGAGSVVGLR